MIKAKLLFRLAAALLIAAGAGQQALAERKGAPEAGVPPAGSTATFKLVFSEQPPVNPVPKQKFTKPADNTQEYNYAELPDVGRGAELSRKGKNCARFIRDFSYGAMDAANAESCAKGCEEIYKHNPGVGANLPLGCKFNGRPVYLSPEKKPVDPPALVAAVRERFFVRDGYHQVFQADLTEDDKGWVVFLRIKGNRRALYQLSVSAEVGGCGGIPWIGLSSVPPKSVELRPGESTINLEMPADELKGKILKSLASRSVDPASCKDAAFLAKLTPELPAESPYVGWAWLVNTMPFKIPVSRLVDKPAN